MKKEKFESQIIEELNHISTGIRCSPQRRLRYVYNIKRRERMDLTKEVVLKACIDAIKKQDSNFRPEYDKEFFEI